ncbi:MAG: DUF3343 domain-containing protein [Deferribacterota bacterium]|nr:DUF3343 domain-containing protein [Deferribacterota bacterium]
MRFFKSKKNEKEKQSGLILFEKVEDAVKTEKLLKRYGYNIKLVAPPPDLRKGCDLSIAFNIVELLGIENLLKDKKINFLEIKSLESGSELLDIVKVVDFGSAVMVKAGNMKMTIDKNSGVILNTSGGGCPDIPYLNLQLVGKKIDEVKRPKELGLTLCALMLDRAYEECLKIFYKEKKC